MAVGLLPAPKADDFTDSVKYSDWAARENPDFDSNRWKSIFADEQ